MDDISRESLPDRPGQRVDSTGVRSKDPAEWTQTAEVEGSEDLEQHDYDSQQSAAAIEARSQAPAASSDGPEREELLMALDSVSGESSGDEDAPMEDSPGADSPGLAGSEEDKEFSESPAEDELSRVVGALLMSSRESLSLLRLAQSTNTTPKQVRVALTSLSESLETAGLALEVSINGDQVRLLTTPDVFDYLRNLRVVKKREKLSAAALETLAVIAYRQPVMRAEIEAIRGVKAGPILRTLLDHRMIKMVGRADVPGRPLQYGTTQHFLETFGLESLSDLPSVKEFRQL